MGRIETSLQRKIKESLEYFKKAYMKYGYFRLDYGKGLGTENSPDYHEALDSKYNSKIVGNSVFSPRIRRVPIYSHNEQKYVGWQIPHHYEWRLSIHPKLGCGIWEQVDPKNMKEISIDPRCMSDEEILVMIEDFLKLSNEQVMKKFNIDRRIFSGVSLKRMKEMDEYNWLRNQAEESVIKYFENEWQDIKENRAKVETIELFANK